MMDSRFNTAWGILFAVLTFESFLSGTLASVTLLDGETFDFIVVGGGTGGCAVAGRLAESGKHTVLLITEGGLPHPDLDVPAITSSPNVTGDPSIIKVYQSAPQRAAGLARNGTMSHLVGLPLGGGSAVNGMWLNRGHPEDYNNWARITGDESWSYSDLLKYFRKYENYAGINPTDQRGFKGPIDVSFSHYIPSLTEWLQGGTELGYPIEDPNGPQTESFTWVDFSRKNGRRVSSFKGYIGPLLSSATQTSHHSKSPRSNLLILIHTTANRIIFEGNRAVGVRFTTNSTGKAVVGYAKAGKEIIVSAGVMDSPALLLRSGIGPKSVLGKSNIPAVKYLPVGRNLQDHLGLVLPIIFGNKSAALVAERDLTLEARRIYEQTGEGPYSSYLGSGGQAFISSSLLSPSEKSAGWPDIQLLPLNSDSGPAVSTSPILETLNKWETPVWWMVYLGRPKSRGTVTLDSRNIDNPPIIDYQFLTHPDDLGVTIEATKLTLKVCEETSGFQRIGCRYATTPLPACRHLKFRSDPYWGCYIRQLAVAGIHAGGTCKMGSGPEDPQAVVDSQLRVIGIESLTVADASIMPAVTNTNAQAAVYVIAEKAADMILKRWAKNPSANDFVHPLLKLLWP